MSTLEESLLTPLCHFLPTHPMHASSTRKESQQSEDSENISEKMHLLMHECCLHTERACQKGFHCLRSIDTLRQIGLGVNGNLIPSKSFGLGKYR